MSPSTSILRRRFLTFMLWVGALGLCRPLGTWGAVRMSGVHDPGASKLAGVLACKESAAIVGREYLKQVPSEANVQLLLGVICSTWPGRGAELLDTDIEKLRDLVHQQQRDDFLHGRVVNVRGWVLSATEARLCAMRAVNTF